MKNKYIYSAAICLSLLFAAETEAEVVQSQASQTIVPIVASNVAFNAQVKSEQELKLQIVKMVQSYAPTGQISYVGGFLSQDAFNNLIQDIYLQYPYIEGTIGQISYRMSSTGSSATISFNNEYLTTAAQEKYVNEQIPKIVADIIKPGMTDIQKVKAINDYIVLKTEYSEDSKASPHVPYAILAEGKGVCQAYALLALRLLEEVDIEARYVTGFVGEEKHAWNMVKLDGAWYHLDTTWNDPSFTDVSSTFKRHIGYDYFLISDSQILKDHTIDNRGYPKATSKKYDAFHELATYLYTSTNSFNRTPYFVNDKMYAFKESGNQVDLSIYEANLTVNPISFTKIPNIQALTFAASEEAIYYVKANTAQHLVKYNLKTKNETTLSNKKITELYVENSVLVAKSGNETVYSERLRETSSIALLEIAALVEKLAVVDANFEANYQQLKKLEAQVEKNKIAIALQREISRIDTKYNQVTAISSYSQWAAPKTITNAKKPWTINLNGQVKSHASNLSKIKVVDLTKKQLDVTIKIEGSKIIVTPKDSYLPNTPYFLIIDKGLESADGQKSRKGVQLRFTFEQL